jgi:hypothetical protein
MSRYVPRFFAAAAGNDGLNALLHQLAEIFPRSETQPDSNGIKAEATAVFRAYLKAVGDPLTVARHPPHLPLGGNEWHDAICSSFGMAVYEAWFENDRLVELADFRQRHGLRRCNIEERGSEVGCVVTSPDGQRIAYIQPQTFRIRAGQMTVVPLVPPEGAKHLRTQPNGTEVYELDLR